VVGFTSGLAGAVAQAFVLGLLVFSLLADAPRLRSAMLASFSAEDRPRVAAIWDTSLEKTGGYVYPRGLLVVCSAAIVAFWLIGIPLVITQALLVGVISQFVANVGTIIAGAVPVLNTLVNEPGDAIWVIVAPTGSPPARWTSTRR
jgi:predicted PurR-regulated permease PerM